MVGAQEATAELTELIGEELATELIADLVDGIKTQRRPFDEVVNFMAADAAARGDEEGVKRARFAALWRKRTDKLLAGAETDTRYNRVQVFLDLYERAQDKAAVAKLAESQLSRTSYWRFCRFAGLAK